MIDRMRTMFRKYPKIFKFMSVLYQVCVSPILSGHMQYYIKYSLLQKKKEISSMKKYGLTNIRPYRYREWRIGKDIDMAYRRYYLAEYKEEKCFVKIGINDSTVKNECIIMERYKQCLQDISPRYLIGDTCFDGDAVLLVVSYVQGLSMFKIPEEPEKFGEICKQFICILDVLKEQGIVHADIHKGNLMMCGAKIYLLDYGISMVKEKGNNINYIYRPGTFYGIEGNERTYDDAYSFIKMVELLGISEEYANNQFYQEINKRIGVHFFTVVC